MFNLKCSAGEGWNHLFTKLAMSRVFVLASFLY